MNRLTVEGWCRKFDVEAPIPLAGIRFRISAACHLELEKAEEELEKTHAPEKFVIVDVSTLDLELPAEVGALADCQIRVYLSPLDGRGQFHLVGHRSSDGALVYTEPVMVDQLG